MAIGVVWWKGPQLAGWIHSISLQILVYVIAFGSSFSTKICYISTSPIMSQPQWNRDIYTNHVDCYIIVITSQTFGTLSFHFLSDICILLFDVFCGKYPFSPSIFTMPLHASENAFTRYQRDRSPPNSIMLASANQVGGVATPTIHLKTMTEVHHHTDVNMPFSGTSTLVLWYVAMASAEKESRAPLHRNAIGEWVAAAGPSKFMFT